MNINNEPMINEEIRDREVRLIDSDGAQLGIMPTQAAMQKAEEKGLDLVKIVPNAMPDTIVMPMEFRAAAPAPLTRVKGK